jgi:uncharacterized protein (UPF0332 family)
VKEETRKLLDKSARAVRAARLLLENGETDFAAGRAYYAMFYAAEALLWEEGHRSSSHSGVHSLFGERFAGCLTRSTGGFRAITVSTPGSSLRRPVA